MRAGAGAPRAKGEGENGLSRSLGSLYSAQGQKVVYRGGGGGSFWRAAATRRERGGVRCTHARAIADESNERGRQPRARETNSSSSSTYICLLEDSSRSPPPAIRLGNWGIHDLPATRMHKTSLDSSASFPLRPPSIIAQGRVRSARQ